MMRLRFVVPAVLLALTATLAAAQTAPRQQRPTWDASTVTTVKGTVAQSREVGRVEFVMLAVKTDAGPQLVLLGPETALDPSLAKLAQGTEVEVTGSKTKMTTRQEREHDVILASVVKVGGKEYRVRNDQGQLVDKDGKVLQRKR
jgi:hypothetical protein